jgi:DNA-binding transcriptional LysR family regulator
MDERHLAWDDLRFVLAVDRAGTLAGAAARLGTSHPTVFRRLRDVERRLGVVLFERSRAGYTATEEGEELARSAAAVEREIAAVEQRLAGRDLRPAGTLRITTTDTLMAGLLPPLLARFQADHPAIQLEVTTSNALSGLSRREADLAIRAGGAPAEHLVGRRLCSVATALYRPRSLRVKVEAIADAPWVMPDDSLSHLASVRWIEERGLVARATLRANSLLHVREGLRSGLGIGFLPCYLGDPDRALVRLAPPMPALSSDLWLLAHADLRKVTRLRAFYDRFPRLLAPLVPLFEGREGRPARADRSLRPGPRGRRGGSQRTPGARPG